MELVATLLVVLCLILGILALYLVHGISTQQKFWADQVNKLTDKLMSRDYKEYHQVQNPPPPRVVVRDEVPEDLGTLPHFVGLP